MLFLLKHLEETTRGGKIMQAQSRPDPVLCTEETGLMSVPLCLHICKVGFIPTWFMCTLAVEITSPPCLTLPV